MVCQVAGDQCSLRVPHNGSPAQPVGEVTSSVTG
jgi:hypothetical protein